MSVVGDTWSARTYARFAAERSRPFVDLVARIGASDPRVVVDLGCGDGSTTARLIERWPRARVIGVDSSADMLAGAGRRGVEAVHADAATWSPDTAVDVLVTNAALQWIPEHPRLLAEWVRWLSPTGWLALQVPGNFDAPSHRLLREAASRPRWRERLTSVLRHDAVLEPAGYRRVLVAAGLEVDAWETTYLHQLSGSDPVLRWTRGTALRPVLAALGSDVAEFEEEYAALLRTAYPVEPDSTVLFPFRRIFAVGHVLNDNASPAETT